MFCSADCMAAAQVYHQMECAVMPANLDMLSPPEVLLVRIISAIGVDAFCQYAESFVPCKPNTEEEWRTRGFDENGKYISHLTTIANFQVCNEPQKHEQILTSVQVLGLMKLLQLECSPKVAEFIMRIIWRLSSNHIFEIIEYETDGKYHYKINCVGYSTFPTFSLFNHSCDPDVAHYFNKSTIVARSVRNIPKGSQVCISYGRHFLKYPKHVRQEYLTALGLPDCFCKACKNDWPVKDNLPKHPEFALPNEMKMLTRVQASSELINSKTGAGNMGYRVTKENLPLFFKHISLLEKAGKNFNQCYYDILEAIRDYFSKQGNVHIVPTPLSPN